MVHLDLLFSDGLYSCLQRSKLAIFGSLVIVSLAQLINRVFQLAFLLLDVDVVSLKVLVLLLGEDAVELDVEVLDGVLQLHYGLLVVGRALMLFLTPSYHQGREHR